MFFFMRIWCSNYRNMQYWLISNNIPIINPSYDIHRVHESQSDNRITGDLKYYPCRYNKNELSSHNITLYLLLSFKSMIYSLVRESDHFNHTKRAWFPFLSSIFILYKMVNENLACSFWWGYKYRYMRYRSSLKKSF